MFSMLLANACTEESATEPTMQACKLNSDCASGLACSFGLCHTQCAATTDCPAGQKCIKGFSDGAGADAGEGSGKTLVNVCVAVVQCNYSSMCDDPLICSVDKTCRNQCLNDRDCTGKQVCVHHSVCADPNELTPSGELVNAVDGGTGPGSASYDDGGGEGSALLEASTEASDGASADGAGGNADSGTTSEAGKDAMAAVDGGADRDGSGGMDASVAMDGSIDGSGGMDVSAGMDASDTSVGIDASAGVDGMLGGEASVDGSSPTDAPEESSVVPPQAPISLTVIANPDPSVSNGLVLYEFKVTNTGGTTLTNVVLSDTTQNAAKAYGPQITGGGGCGNQIDVYSYCQPGTIVTWPAFTLAPGQTQTVWLPNYVLNGTANGTVIHNTATVNFAGKTVMQPRDVTVDASVALHLGITEDVNPVHPGSQVTYTVTVGNTGTQTVPVSNAGVLTATIPAGMSFVSATAGGTSSNGKVQWNLGAVDPGQAQQLSYTLAVGGDVADGTVLLPAAEFLDEMTSLTRATSLTEIRAGAPLTLEMMSNPDPAAANEIVSYELKVTNTSGGTLTNIVLSDTTQFGASAYQPEISGGGGCGNQVNVYNYCTPGTIVAWPGFTLAPGQTQTMWLTSVVANSTTGGNLIRNQARVAYTGGMVTETSDLTVNSQPSLRVGVTEDHNPVRSGDQLTYTVTVGNTGTVSNLPISNAGVLTATIPTGTTFVSATGGGTNSNGTVSWSFGSVNPSSDQHYTYTVAVGNLADGTILLPKAALLDGTTSVARASSLTEVRSTVPLKLTMVANPDPAPANGLIWYELRATNTGSSTLTNIGLSDVTQNAASTYQPETTGGGGCGSQMNVYNYCTPGTIVSWPAFTLAAGQTQTVWMPSFVVNATASGTLIRNQARLTYAGGMVLATKDLTVENTAYLHVDMTTNHDPVHPGDKLVYTLTVTNTGSQALPLSSAGVLSATIPAGSAFSSASTGGVNSNATVQWSIGFVNPGSSQKYTFAVDVGGSLADGSLLESAAQVLDSSASLARTTTSTEVRASPPLTLTVSVSPDPVAPNALATYTFVVTNTSGSTLTNVVLSDSTQNAGSAYQPSITGGGTCGSAADVYNYCQPGTIVTWPAATLTSGQALTASRIDKIVNGTPNGTLVHNQARVSYATGMIVKSTDISTHQ